MTKSTRLKGIRCRDFEILAHLAKKLKAVPEGDGNMLDNTMIISLPDDNLTAS